MLEKKDMVQKSFRVDRKVDEALSKLAEILNRSQNELVDYALRKIISENRQWFAGKFVGEYYDKISPNMYTPYTEAIEQLELVFQPYDFRTNEGAFVILREKIGDDGIEELYRCNVGNSPSTNSRIMDALGEIGRIIGKRYPELAKKYEIINIDV